MKITVNIEATPQEVREFFGLPDIRPLQEEMLQNLHDSMQASVSGGFDPSSVMKVLFPAQLQSLESLQKTFWDAFNSAAQSAQHHANSDENAAAKPTKRAKSRNRSKTSAAARTND